MIKNILVALDGSPCAEGARRYAVALALKLGAQLEAVHVVDTRLFAPPACFAAGPAGPVAYPASTARDIQQILRRRGEACLAEAASRSEAEGLPISTSLLLGHPAQLLAELQARTELLVIGRQGENSPADSSLTGSTADRLVRRACRPCLVVPPDPPPPDRLLAAVDGSPHSFRAAHVAFELANALSAPLVIFAAAERPADLPDAQACADKAHRLARAHDCAAATLVAEGPAARLVLESARKTACSLIVAGSHGHGWIYDRIIGTTAAHLLANSPLPLLLVR